MRYKVGDSVRVRKDLKLHKKYGRYLTCNDSMVKKAGLVVTIKECDNVYSRYKIDSDDWNWCDEMFEGLAEMQSAELKEGLDDENTNGNTIRPGYYESAMGDVFDIANAYGLDMPLGTATKYILRAGKKDKSKEIEDLEKAIQCIQRAIELRRAKDE